jgi:hypothetical protein
MSGTSLALKIGSLVLGLGTYFIMFKKVKGLKRYGWSSLVFVLITSLLISASSLLLFLKPNMSEMTTILFAQLIIISLGALHVLLSKKLLPWYHEHTFGMQIIFIICILLFGYFFFNMAFTFLVNPDVEFVWYLSLLWFLVPVLLNQTVNKLLEVPPKKFKSWTYPMNINIEDPSDEEMENPVVISFVFKKRFSDKETTTFRAKAPEAMSLGRLFYFFINDYNSRHPEGPVSFTGTDNEPDEWIFFKIRNKLLNIKSALDPEDSISDCKVKENDVIKCERVTGNYKSDIDQTIEETDSVQA